MNKHSYSTPPAPSPKVGGPNRSTNVFRSDLTSEERSRLDVMDLDRQRISAEMNQIDARLAHRPATKNEELQLRDLDHQHRSVCERIVALGGEAERRRVAPSMAEALALAGADMVPGEKRTLTNATVFGGLAGSPTLFADEILTSIRNANGILGALALGDCVEERLTRGIGSAVVWGVADTLPTASVALENVSMASGDGSYVRHEAFWVKVGATAGFSSELLRDAGVSLTESISDGLRQAIEFKLSALSLSGTSAAPSGFGPSDTFLGASAVPTMTGSNSGTAMIADLVQASNVVRANGFEPNAAVISASAFADFLKVSTDGAAMGAARIERDTGLRLFFDRNVPSTKALVGQFDRSTARLVTRSRLDFQLFSLGGGQFAFDTLNARATMRFAQAIFAPTAFVTITGL